MIENRLRLEREILRGRRAVRRSMPAKERMPLPDEMSSFDPGNQPDTNLESQSFSAPLDYAQEGGHSWPMDTDTDVPSRVQIKDRKLRARVSSGELPISGTSTPVGMKDSQDPLRSVARRRRWASHLLEDGDSRSPQRQEESGNSIPPTSATSNRSFLHLPHLPTGILLARFKPKAFSKLSSPFQSIRKSDKLFTEQIDDAWSSDSSDLDEDLDVHEGEYFESLGVGIGHQEQLVHSSLDDED